MKRLELWKYVWTLAPYVLGVALGVASLQGFAHAQTATPPTGTPVVYDTGYKLTKKFIVPGEGGWDYIAVDSDARRVYVSHGDLIQVLNADNGKLVGEIAAPGAHGVAFAQELKRGFTSNGRDKSVTIFNTDTLKTIKTTKLESGTDGILYDPFTKRVFPMNEKITVIDAETGDVSGTVDLKADPEGSASDGKGTIYINEADKAAVAVVDAKALTVTKEYPIKECQRPHSLSYDARTMAFDPKTKNIYLPTQDVEWVPDSDPAKPPKRIWKPGSFKVLVVSRKK